MVGCNGREAHIWKGQTLSLVLGYCYFNILDAFLTMLCLNFALDPVNYLAAAVEMMNEKPKLQH